MPKLWVDGVIYVCVLHLKRCHDGMAAFVVSLAFVYSSPSPSIWPQLLFVGWMSSFFFFGSCIILWMAGVVYTRCAWCLISFFLLSVCIGPRRCADDMKEDGVFP